MSFTGEQQLRQIMRDVACPHCRYNLRGLYGDAMTCPECGQWCDVAMIIVRRWQGPWYAAPWLTRLELAGIWAVGFLGAMLAVSLWTDKMTRDAVVAWGLIGVAGWVWLLWRVGEPWATWRGRSLVALAHGVVLEFVIGIGVVVAGLFQSLLALIDKRYVHSVWLLAVAALGIAVIWLARWLEQRLALGCIRLYLNSPRE